MDFSTGTYRIEITSDPTYKIGSADNVHLYDSIYPCRPDCEVRSFYSVKVLREDVILKSAVIGGDGRSASITPNQVVLEVDRILICYDDIVSCFSIPDLHLLWQTTADSGICFELFSVHDFYIVHGELEITRLDREGKIVWQKSGADIFTTLDGTDTFKITDSYIMATDWENRTYMFDFNGKSLLE